MRKGSSIMTAPTHRLYRNSSSDASALPITFTGNQLRDKEFPSVTWAIPDLLPAGVTLFGGREKMGKTWLGYGLGTAVATGGYALGKIPVEQGDTLYLSLEDPERRLYNRIRKLARRPTSHASTMRRSGTQRTGAE
jgi:RecA-family ATPase